MAYLLNREALRVVRRDDRGRVVYRKRYKKGDEVDTSQMEDHRVEHFVEKGVLVQSEDDLSGTESAGATSPATGPFGAATREATEGPEAEGQTGGEPHDVDQYDSMDYSELQQAAKQRNLNAGGSAEDLRNRLREDDES